MNLRLATGWVRRVTVTSLLVALVACTTTTGDQSPPDPGDRPGAVDRSPRADDPAEDSAEVPDDVYDAITSAGIVVTDEAGAVQHPAVPPATGISMTVTEVERLVREAAQGAGTPGRTLDGWDPLESTCRHASLSIL